MNNVIGLILGITDKNNPEWKYINRKGHVITCTKKQFCSYYKKKKSLTHEEVMKKALDTFFAPCPFYFWIENKMKGDGKM